MNEIVDVVRTFEGVLVVIPDENSGLPEIAWGDAFFYYAPDGMMPERTQPYGTIVTKNYPDDEASRLDEPDGFRLNIRVGHDRTAQLADADADPAVTDAFAPHPLYSAAGWVSVVNPAANTAEQVLALLRDAHAAAQARATRRAGNA